MISPISAFNSISVETAEIHGKGWGREEWIVNNGLYCGKKLILNKDKKCSIHYHIRKYETFYIEEGKVQMYIYPNGEVNWLETELDEKNKNLQDLVRQLGQRKCFIMKKGDVLHIPRGLPHQFYGLEDSKVFEFSTEHFEEDSYRIERGD